MKHNNQQTKPLARKDGLVIQELPDEVLVYDLERDRAHCLNQTAARVWQSCDGKSSPAKIAQTLSHDANRKVDETIVWLALEQLQRNHLLHQKVTFPSALTGINRRAMIKSLGIAAAITLPLVTSIVAPTPVQAATLLGPGSACTAGAQCASGVCDGTGHCT